MYRDLIENRENREKKGKIKSRDQGKFQVDFELLNESRINKDWLGSEMIFENSKWLNTVEAATYLRTTPRQMRKWVYQGKVKAYKLFNKSLRFKKPELDLLLEGGDQKWE